MNITNKIKYSILVPYHNRARELQISLQSYSNRYRNIRNDFEFIIVEDGKNADDIDKHVALKSVTANFSHLNITHFYGDKAMNPAKHFNQAARNARGDIFILTNPETAIMTDVFGMLDGEARLQDSYILGSCANCKNVCFGTDGMLSGELVLWYHHSQHRCTYLHFYSALSKETYFRVGGFDEEYIKGMSYDDSDFVNAVAYNDIPIIFRDDIYTMHIQHDISYQRENIHLVDANRNYYMQKWGISPERVNLVDNLINKVKGV